MHTHKLRPDGFRLIKNNLLKKFLGTSLALCFLAPVAAIWGLGMRPFNTLVLVVVLILICLLNYFRSLRTQKEDVASYELTLTEDVIIRKQAELPEVEIRREQVTGIHETIGAGLLVTTKDCYKYIFIPAILESYDDVKDQLRYWKPIEMIPVRRSPFVIILPACAVSAAFMSTILAKSMLVYIVSGVALNLFLAFNLYQLHRKKDIEQRTKRKKMVLYLLVFSLSILILRILQQMGIW